MGEHAEEIARGQRFKFGKNWQQFLSVLNDDRIVAAEKSLCAMLETDTLDGKSFLDIGSGSGLFSLAAMRLGASKVHSFDYDPQSVACAKELKRRYFPESKRWTNEEGSVLDINYVTNLGTSDIVFSWGVLHHTCNMWTALHNAALPVRRSGKLFIAIYNDQGSLSKYWLFMKKAYNQNLILRMVIILIHCPYLIGVRFLARAWSGRLRLERGMSLWHDMKDWLGGYPFEVAKPDEIVKFYTKKGFNLQRLKTCMGRHGCNEYVFVKCAE